MLLQFLTDATKVVVDVARDGKDWRLIVDGQEIPLQASPDDNGVWLVETHQGRRRLWVASRGEDRLVFCDGKVHTLRLHDPEIEDEEDLDQASPNLTADMPGKVVEIKVKAGQFVEKGQTLLILESMKMETELGSAVTGTVVKIHVAPGQIVGQGEPLVEIEPETEESE